MSSTFTNLAGKRGVVLGIANDKSIAAAVTRCLVSEGAQVLATCLNEKAATFAKPVTEPLGVELVTCNVEDPTALDTLFERAASRWGGIDFAVHSIAWAPLEDLHGRVADSSREGFEKAIGISCHSFAEMAKRCEPLMKEGGSLVTMSYLGAQQVVANYGLMGPVKAALESTVRYLATELGPKSIRVHAVSPGPVPTRAASGIANFDQLMASAAQRSPLGRLVTIDEVAQLTTFLCSPASSGMTGQTIFVDAGFNVLA